LIKLTEQDRKDLITCIDVTIAEAHPSEFFEIRLKALRKKLKEDDQK
jgi:hypothetical protein